jgi:hypothetical protein
LAQMIDDYDFGSIDKIRKIVIGQFRDALYKICNTQ